ncbi:hypothetical protein L7F22_001161 [Adiantum nelumboides]|nr:hypothetical protein [Adiantum nelumboides]
MSLSSRHSSDLNKVVYEDHRKYLDEGCSKPYVWNAKDWFDHWQKSALVETSNSRSKKNTPGMRTLNCFHSLPYWHKLLINHLLDPMHIFKNVSHAKWDHLIGKRDTIGCRKDLETVNRMPHLWVDENGNKPKAPWILSKQEFTMVKEAIKKFRTPTGTMRSLKGCFTSDGDLSRLKSHDWHKFLQFILPIAISGCLTDLVRKCIYKLGELVRWISCKEINPTTIARARKDAIETVCALEEHFPTSILNIQVHLLVHLVDEVEIAGTVHAQWMFFLERFMKTLKGFVRQRARPEGSMAEGWMVQESCVFISEYLTRSQNNIIELWNIKDDERVVSEVPQGNGVVKRFSEAEQTKVVFYLVRPNPRWWYVIQTAPRSRHIFYERGVEEFLPGEAMEEDHQTDEEHRTIAPPRELCAATDETSSDDSSNEGDNDLSNGNDDDPFNSLDMNDMVPA